jgi:hypothetical protein
MCSLGYETLLIFCEVAPVSLYGTLRAVCRASEKTINRRVTHVHRGWIVPEFAHFVSTKLPNVTHLYLKEDVHDARARLSQHAFCDMLTSLARLKYLSIAGGKSLDDWFLPYIQESGGLDMYFQRPVTTVTTMHVLDYTMDEFMSERPRGVSKYASRLLLMAEEWSVLARVTIVCSNDGEEKDIFEVSCTGGYVAEIEINEPETVSDLDVCLFLRHRYTCAMSRLVGVCIDLGYDDSKGVEIVAVLDMCVFLEKVHLSYNYFGHETASALVGTTSLRNTVKILGLYSAFKYENYEDIDANDTNAWMTFVSTCWNTVLAGSWPAVTTLYADPRYTSWMTRQWLIANRERWPSLVKVGFECEVFLDDVDRRTSMW